MRRLLLLLLVAPAWAQSPQQALLCAGCHGTSGEGRPEAGYPRIAGQPQRYLERQLAAYADGRRKSIIMSPLARDLSPEARARLAAHFAAAAPAATARAAQGGEQEGRGKILATVGDNELRVPACQNCHGPRGAGQPPVGPYLAGLHAAYLKEELLAWKEGRRDTDSSGSMRVIAANLSAADIEALAEYFAGLPPPGARPLR